MSLSGIDITDNEQSLMDENPSSPPLINNDNDNDNQDDNGQQSLYEDNDEVKIIENDNGDVKGIIEEKQEEHGYWGLEEYGIPKPSGGKCDPALEAKFKHFADLRAQGVKFNDSLMRNKAFRNPNILQKLVQFVDVDDKASNIPKSVWDFHGLPQEAYASNISARQKQRAQEREAAQQPGKHRSISFAKSSSMSSNRDERSRDNRDKYQGSSGSTSERYNINNNNDSQQSYHRHHRHHRHHYNHHHHGAHSIREKEDRSSERRKERKRSRSDRV